MKFLLNKILLLKNEKNLILNEKNFIEKRMIRMGCYSSLVLRGLAIPIINLKNAKQGDFIQFWRKNNTGHSVIFDSINYNENNEIELRYWSTQRSTNGIGYCSELLNKISELFICRLNILY
jgi:hypothetical protein